MLVIKKQKGVALILACMLVVVFALLGGATLARSIAENRVVERHLENVQAFWAAEAGINHALAMLRDTDNWNNLSSLEDEIFGYSVVITGGGLTREARATGIINDTQREIEVIITKIIPEDFYSNAIYTAGRLNINGNAYNVYGNVIHTGDTDVEHPGKIDGDYSDTALSPLARFNFDQLKEMSEKQGNYYDSDPNTKDLPGSFWYEAPTDPEDPSTGTPNVVYIEGDLQLNGNINVGGFYVVVGDVITDPDGDTTINGTGQIEGVVYTLGTFRVNGGGQVLNINGGIWAGQEARVNGSVDIDYNDDYMKAIEALDIDPVPQITVWVETDNPYQL